MNRYSIAFMTSVVGFIAVFLLSLIHNGVETSFIRGGIAFVAFFVIGLLFAIGFSFSFRPKPIPEVIQVAEDAEEGTEEKSPMEAMVDQLSDEDIEQMSKYVSSLLDEEKR